MPDGGSADTMDAVEVVFDGSAGKLVQTFTNVGRGLARMIQNLKVGQVAMAAFVVGVAAATFVAARRAVAAAATIDAALREVATLLGETGEGMIFLRKQILALSTSIPTPPEVLTRGLYQVVSAGITDTADALNVLRVSARAAVAGLTDTFTAVDAITTVLNAFELDASEAARVADVLFATVREGKVTFPELAKSIGNVATSAGIGRIKIEELGGAIAALTKFGLSANKATTALNSLLISMINPVDKVQEAAFELGIQWDAAALEAKGLSGVMQELADVAQGNAQIVARLVPQIRSYRAGAVLAGRGNKEFNRITLELVKSQGVLSEAFDAVSGSLENQRTILSQNINKLWAELGFEILPKVTGVLEDINDALLDPRLRLAQVLEDAGKLQQAFEFRRIVALEDVNAALEITTQRASEALGDIKAFAELLATQRTTRFQTRGREPDTIELSSFLTLSDALQKVPEARKQVVAFWRQITEEARGYEDQLEKIQNFLKDDVSIITEQLRNALSEEDFNRVARTLANFVSTVQQGGRALNSLINQTELQAELQEATLGKLQAEAEARNKIYKTDFDLLRERIAREEGVLEALEAQTGASEADIRTQRLRLELAEVELALLKAQQEQKQKGLDKEAEINLLYQRRRQIIGEIGQDARSELADITQELGLLQEAGADPESLRGLEERKRFLEGEVAILTAIETFGISSLKTQRLIAAVEQSRLDRAAERRELLAQEREDEEAILRAKEQAERLNQGFVGVSAKPTAPFGLDPSSPDTLAKVAAEIEPMIKLVEDAQVELEQWRKISNGMGLELEQFIDIMSGINPKFGEYIRALKAIAEGTDDWRDRLVVITSTVAQASRSVLQFGQAIGALGDNTVRTLGAMIELGQAISNVVASGKGLFDVTNLGNLASIVGSGLNLIGSLGSAIFGGGDDEEAKRIAEENRKEAERLRETLERNNQRLVDLSVSLSEFADAVIGFSGDFLAGIRDALALADVDAQVQDILRRIAEARAGGTTIPGGFVIPLGQAYSAVRKDIIDSLRASNLTIKEVETAASSLGIEVGELIDFLNGAEQSAAEMNAAMEQANDLMEGLADRGLDTAFEGFGGQLDLLRLKFELFDITNPIEQLEEIQRVLQDVGNINLDNIEDDNIRDALATLLTGDLTTPEGRKAMDDAIRTIYEAIASGALTFGDLGGLTLPQLTDLLQEFEGALDDMVDSADSGAEAITAVNRITTEQADIMIALDSTRNFYLRSMLGIMEGGAVAPPLASDFEQFGNQLRDLSIEFEINVTEASDATETAHAVALAVDRELGGMVGSQLIGTGAAPRRNR
jgi:TP901 family phage tail tape measure protein